MALKFSQRISNLLSLGHEETRWLAARPRSTTTPPSPRPGRGGVVLLDLT